MSGTVIAGRIEPYDKYRDEEFIRHLARRVWCQLRGVTINEVPEHIIEYGVECMSRIPTEYRIITGLPYDETPLCSYEELQEALEKAYGRNWRDIWIHISPHLGIDEGVA